MRASFYADKNLDLTTFKYEDLAKPEWKGKVRVRSGQHPYNVALTASYILHHGEADTKTWLEGVKANLRASPAAATAMSPATSWAASARSARQPVLCRPDAQQCRRPLSKKNGARRSR